MTMTAATALSHYNDALDKLEKARAGDYTIPGFSVSRSIGELQRQVAMWERRYEELSTGASRGASTATAKFS